MLDALKKFVLRRETEDAAGAAFADDDKRLAEAALMFHVIAADGVVTDDERERLYQVLSQHFGLEAAETRRLVEQARKADSEAIDLYGFTRTLNRELDKQERLALIGNLWELVYADGEIHEFEDNIVWRVAELLHVDSRDRMELKRQYAARLQAEDDDGVA